MIHVDLTGAAPFFGAHTPDYAAAEAAHRTLSEKTGAGSDFLGWTELPRRIRETELARILAAGKAIREKGDALVVVGIGGSYLGARAARSCSLPETGFPQPRSATRSKSSETAISA